MNELVALTQQYFEALSKNDMIFVDLIFADDIIWHQPGKSALAGVISGKKEVFEHLGKLMILSQGTFAINKVDYITSNGNTVAASINFLADVNGRSMSMKGVDLIRFENNKMKEIWLFSEDINNEDEFWTWTLQ